MTIIKAKSATQCPDNNGVIGDFLYTGDIKEVFEVHSPTFEDLVGLFDWLKANNWTIEKTDNPYMPLYVKEIN